MCLQFIDSMTRRCLIKSKHIIALGKSKFSMIKMKSCSNPIKVNNMMIFRLNIFIHSLRILNFVLGKGYKKSH